MTDSQDKKDLPAQAGEIKVPEKEISASEQRKHFEMEGERELAPEKKEVSPDEKIIADELRREIEMMEMEEGLKEEAKKKAQQIDFLAGQDKIEHLLAIAREKGIVFAKITAKEMKDPYILDILHDVLAREGYYKKFIK